MNTSVPTATLSAHHPWNIQLQPGEKKHLHSKLIGPLLAGLVESGAVFCHLRQNKPFRHEGAFKFDLAGKRWHLHLNNYCSLRWVWRVTVGFPALPYALARQCEFTVCLEKVTQELGRGLGATLQAMTKDETPAWPMFNAWESFPQYSWSILCHARYEEWRQWRDARRESLTRKQSTLMARG
jgi:hypothetical protein